MSQELDLGRLILSPIIEKYHRSFTIMEIGEPESAFCVNVSKVYNLGVFILFGKSVLGPGQIQRALLGKSNLIWLNKEPSLQNIEQFSQSEHVDIAIFRKEASTEWKNYLDLAQKMAHTIVLEIPKQGSAEAQDYLYSHEQLVQFIDGEETYFYVLENDKEFWIEKSTMIHPKRLDRSYFVECNYKIKRFHKTLQSQVRVSTEWVQGINLITFLMFNGAFPLRTSLVKKLPTGANHCDWMPNNMIVGGEMIYLIDDESKGYTSRSNLKDCKELILKTENKSPKEIRSLFCKIFHAPQLLQE
jgi:hypothetical protein